MIIEVFDSWRPYPRNFDVFITHEGKALEQLAAFCEDDGIIQVILERGPVEFPSYAQVDALGKLMREHGINQKNFMAFYMQGEVMF
ncbi:hypothetical protein N5C66_03790 [Rhizobium pusense]|uniref:hypothetical protein n=1 Tax=Rhizobium/Agrobacterium group TaxID=227290 RepID=UPI000D1AC41C|nr:MULTISPECIES: hypothetical protein [Rhizobium/Agrobacterium group]MDH0908440.1 hypothetical protein [Agrobacterium pusense]MDH1094272.1 hypothetical protein [Agrobacterium pusense]MDH1110854.1 hypothetical protein [Agrobacterium pusense]MDH2192142.1 hypothetical protein [Agrobacterium pusense]CAD7043414.1 hypothetical protein RP007_01018 [Rhizobium sp. P007]